MCSVMAIPTATPPSLLLRPASSQVWSPELAKSILLRGAAEDEEVFVALEYFNFPPISGYSTELREVGTSLRGLHMVTFSFASYCFLFG